MSNYIWITTTTCEMLHSTNIDRVFRLRITHMFFFYLNCIVFYPYIPPHQLPISYTWNIPKKKKQIPCQCLQDKRVRDPFVVWPVYLRSMCWTVHALRYPDGLRYILTKKRFLQPNHVSYLMYYTRLSQSNCFLFFVFVWHNESQLSNSSYRLGYSMYRLSNSMCRLSNIMYRLSTVCIG